MTLYSRQAKGWSPVLESDAGNLHCAIGYVAAADVLNIVQNDVCEMVKVPVGAVIVDCLLDIPNVGANVNVSVGDGDSVAYLIAIQAGSTAALVRRNVTGSGVPKQYTVEDTIDIKFTNADPTNNSAFSLYVLYVCGIDITP